MKNKILYIVSFFLLFLPLFEVKAEELCSPNGYTVITINGMVTTHKGAIYNKDSIERIIKLISLNQNINVDYIYNSMHLGGVGDAVDASYQKLFEKDTVSDYDLKEMVVDLSKKVKTQKVLFIAHSQGNFYANNIYENIGSKPGGIPKESMSIYGIGTPASYVAGNGKYITSSTDGIINLIRKIKFLKVLPPNVDIEVPADDDSDGHNLSKIYLKFEGNRITFEIRQLLSQLKNNDVQNVNENCISPPKINFIHKMKRVALVVADPVSYGIRYSLLKIYDVGEFIIKGIGNAFGRLYANVIGSFQEDEIPSGVILDNSNNPPTEEYIQEEGENLSRADQYPPFIEILEDEPSEDPLVQTEDTPSPEDVPEVVNESEAQNTNIILNTGGGWHPSDNVSPVVVLNGEAFEVVTKGSVYVDPGATATDAVDGNLTVSSSGLVDTSTIGVYTITYSVTDSSGNIGNATRTVKVSTYKYIPKYKFGNENGDGNDWQAWQFNGSNAFDWTNTYVNNYLREQFKIKTITGGFWCSQCLQRGIFNHDPQKGFETNDFVTSPLEGNPQNNMNGVLYEVVIQWDSTGYTYTISHDGIIDSSGHTNVLNMNNDMWVGWDGSHNNFQTFPSGNWIGTVGGSIMGRTGGSGMVLEPFPVYKNISVSQNSSLSIPNKGTYTTNGINPTRGRKNLTPFSFEVIYTDPNNNAPQNIKVYITNTTTSTQLSPLDLQKISNGAEDISDGNFINGEAYVATNLTYDLGDYEYYFSGIDSNGNSIRIPDTGAYRFQAIPSTYTYIPKYTFGSGNGDGNDWQAWHFNGSSAYDWTDTYVNNYLHEQFKIKTISGGFWCSQCLQRGIFNHDPQKGFETTDLLISQLENNPQNNMDNKIYDVSIQWDATGYTYTISQGGITINTGHTNVTGINNDFWVGWDGSHNNFQTFPSGNWVGTSIVSPPGYTGGSGMMIQPYPIYNYSGPVLSNEKKILSFDFNGLIPSVSGTIDEVNHTVSLSVPYGTDVTNLVSTITISANAQISPTSGIAQNFTNPVTYTVTAENNSTQDYIVTVTVLPDPTDTTPPSVSSYTFNGTSSDVTANPTTSNPLVIVINASENVNWMSIKIENQADNTLYKIFMSDSSGCIDGTNTCTKSWNGALSSGGLLQSGVYKIKLHTKDLANNEFYEYLSPYIINIDTTI